MCGFHVGCAEPLSRDLPAHRITALLMEGLLLRSAGALSARVGPHLRAARAAGPAEQREAPALGAAVLAGGRTTRLHRLRY